MYVSYYIRVHPALTILQSGIEKVDFEMLQSKIPIIVTDRIVDVHDVLTNIFKYQYTFINTILDTNKWIRNCHKYMLVKMLANKKIQIAHPHSDLKKEDYEFVDVVMRKDQVVILPYGWWILPTSSVEIYQLDDMVSKMISYIL